MCCPRRRQGRGGGGRWRQAEEGLVVEATSRRSGGWTRRPLGALLGAAPWGPPGRRVGGRARLTQSHPHCRLCLTPYFLWVQLFLLLLSALLPTVSQGRPVCRVQPERLLEVKVGRIPKTGKSPGSPRVRVTSHSLLGGDRCGPRRTRLLTRLSGQGSR